MEERVNIIYHPLPLSIRGFVTQTFDDNGEPFYTICLNTAFNAEVQYRTFRHEIAHIAHNDFDSNMPIGEIEAIRHLI
nr:MAG TPA: Protein of unknown function (DUF3920) [Caudoviricetes sp.]